MAEQETIFDDGTPMLFHPKQENESFLKWFFRVDVKDKWNWILFGLAIALFWWGIKNILTALQFSAP